MADTATSTQAPVEPKAAPNVDEMLDQKLGAAPEQQQPPPAAAPTWRDAVLDDIPDENFKGKKAADLYESWKNGQEAVRRFQSERDRAAAELQRTQTQLTARQAAEQSVREMFRPQEPQQQEDPRYAQLNDLMFSDPAAFNKLRQQLDDERVEKVLAQREEKIRREVTQEAQTRENQRIGRWAFDEARRSLNGRGIGDDKFTKQRIAALYTAITLPSTPDAPNPYYDQGGPLSPAVIFQAWNDLFGLPQQPANEAPNVAAAAPAVVAPPPPPGGGRPSPAVTPPPARADNGKPMSNELRAVMESFAEEAGKPKDHLIKRARGVA